VKGERRGGAVSDASPHPPPAATLTNDRLSLRNTGWPLFQLTPSPRQRSRCHLPNRK